MPHIWAKDPQGGYVNTRTGVKIQIKTEDGLHGVYIGPHRVFATTDPELAADKLAAVIAAMVDGGDTVVVIDDL